MEPDNVSAIVTGAASGLGNAAAVALAARGACVFGLDLDATQGPWGGGPDERRRPRGG